MVLSDTTNKNGMIQWCENLCRLGDGGITNNATLLKIFIALLNDAYIETVMEIKSVDRPNKWDDFNYADYPDAPITMQLGVGNYTIPVADTGDSVNTNLGIRGIYFLSGGERTYLSAMGPSDTISSNAGEPTAFILEGGSIFFDRPFDASTLTKYSSTFYVEYSRSPKLFSSAALTQEPGFLSPYHNLLPIRASSWYLLPKDPNLAIQYETRYLTRRESLKRDTALFNDATPRNMTGLVQDTE